MTDPQLTADMAMPVELAAAVRRLDRAHRRAANTGWLNAGSEGRRRYAELVNSKGFEWARQLRCKLAVRRLIRAAAPWL